MKRSRFLIPSTGFAITLVLLFGLGLGLWVSGVRAFNPGKLTAINSSGATLGGYRSHAEFEAECSLCHRPFQMEQGELCLQCHTDVSEEISRSAGLHGPMDAVLACRNCHPDHRGEDAPIAALAREYYDHSMARFILLKHQVDFKGGLMACESCHQGNEFFVVYDTCADCHADQDRLFVQQHLEDFGPSCLDCHDGADHMADFNHAETDFPLTGGHTAVHCVDCHIDGVFEGTGISCGACHKEPEVHQGEFHPDCGLCHTTEVWSPAVLNGSNFDHEITAGFSLAQHALDYAGSPITCLGCHSAGIDRLEVENCITCHTLDDQVFMQEHQDLFGTACIVCHDGVDRMSDFIHDSVFPLDGKHAEIECEGCHIEKNFRGTPSVCVECHAEPELHAGAFGLRCESCHTAEAWSPAPLRVHPFPLDHGGRGGLACVACHTAEYVIYTCYECHEHQPGPIALSHERVGLAEVDLLECAACHPSGD